MQAVYFEAGKINVREIARPRLRKGFALLRMRVAGICNTDLELLRGYYHFAGIPGHEFVGEVVACEEEAWIGERVVGEINLGCEKCEWCRTGLSRHCPRRTVLGIVRHPGAFAGYLSLPVKNLFRVPDGVSDEEAVFTEPLAAACEILEQVKMPKGTRVAVLGDGKLGLLIAQVLQLREMRVDLYGRHDTKLLIAKDLGIVTQIVDRENPQYPKREYQFVVDSTGSAEGFHAALGMTKARGTLILKSTVAEPVAVNMAAVIVNEIHLVGSRCGRFVDALKLLKRGELRLREMVVGSYPLSEAPQAIRAAQTKGALKILLAGSGKKQLREYT